MSNNNQRSRADTTLKAKEMAKGATVEGYLKSFVKTESNFGGRAKTEEHPLIVGKDGKSTLIWKGGNITSAIKEALSDNEAPIGSYVVIKCLGPKGSFKTNEGVKTFNKFSVSVDASDTIDVTQSKAPSNNEF